MYHRFNWSEVRGTSVVGTVPAAPAAAEGLLPVHKLPFNAAASVLLYNAVYFQIGTVASVPALPFVATPHPVPAVPAAEPRFLKSITGFAELVIATLPWQRKIIQVPFALGFVNVNAPVLVIEIDV